MWVCMCVEGLFNSRIYCVYAQRPKKTEPVVHGKHRNERVKDGDTKRTHTRNQNNVECNNYEEIVGHKIDTFRTVTYYIYEHFSESPACVAILRRSQSQMDRAHVSSEIHSHSIGHTPYMRTHIRLHACRDCRFKRYHI